MKKSEFDPTPFRVTVREGVVIIDSFDPVALAGCLGMDRELPVIRDMVARLVEDGHTRFAFDLTSVNAWLAYPIAKWGGMYGALFGLKLRDRAIPPAALAQGIKLVGNGDSWQEIRRYRLDHVFECLDSVDASLASLQRFTEPSG